MLGLVYTGASIATAFLAAAIGFGALSLAGYTAKRDPASAGSFFITGLVGLLDFINLFQLLLSIGGARR